MCLLTPGESVSSYTACKFFHQLSIVAPFLKNLLLRKIYEFFSDTHQCLHCPSIRIPYSLMSHTEKAGAAAFHARACSLYHVQLPLFCKSDICLDLSVVSHFPRRHLFQNNITAFNAADGIYHLHTVSFSAKVMFII